MEEYKDKDISDKALKVFDYITNNLKLLIDAEKDGKIKLLILQAATHAVFHKIMEEAPSGLHATKFIVGELDHMLEHRVEQHAEELLEDLKEDILEETAASGTMH